MMRAIYLNRRPHRRLGCGLWLIPGSLLLPRTLDPKRLKFNPLLSRYPVMMFPALPQNRNPETEVTTAEPEGAFVAGSIQRATTFTPCIACAGARFASTK